MNEIIAQNTKHLSDLIKKQHQDVVIQRYETLFLQSKDSGISENKYGENLVIVSLTSYGSRIHRAYLTIESIMQQTLKPNKIVLWLDRDEFTSESIPTSLKKLLKRGLEIKYTEDIKSYKKLIPTLIDYPEDIIITVDDDCIYPINLIDNLYSQHKEHPKDVICTQAHIIEFDENGDLKPYSEWTDPPKDKSRSSYSFLPIGFGGVLYPPHCLHPDVLEKNVFMSLAPMADDLWFKIMSLRNHTLCRTAPIYTDIFDWITVTNIKYDEGLSSTNITFNNTQLTNLMLRYNISKYDFDVFKKTSERIIPELYQESIEQWILLLKHKYAYELALSKISKENKVLEIGCGDGYGSNILANSGAEIVALDVDPQSIEYAKHKYSKNNLTFEVFDGSNIPFKDHSFDLILSFQVIEHVANIEIYCKNICRLIKPDGLILITTPNRTYRLTQDQLPWNPYHLTEYNENTAKEIAKKYFPNYNIYSITASPEILEIEKERCRPMRDDFDKNDFHYIFKRSNYIKHYSTKEFFLSTENIDNGLDLLITNKIL